MPRSLSRGIFGQSMTDSGFFGREVPPSRVTPGAPRSGRTRRGPVIPGQVRPVCTLMPSHLSTKEPPVGHLLTKETVRKGCAVTGDFGAEQLGTLGPGGALVERRDHHGLDRVQPVLGLIKCDIGR